MLETSYGNKGSDIREGFDGMVKTIKVSVSRVMNVQRRLKGYKVINRMLRWLWKSRRVFLENEEVQDFWK